MKKTLVAAACTAVGLAVALPAAYAGPPPSEPPACMDIAPGSTATYASVYTRATLVDHDNNPITAKEIDQREIVGGGLLTVNMKLAGPSCTDANYALSVYSPFTDARGRLQLLETYAIPGNGTDAVLALETIVNDVPDTTPTGASPDPRACVKLLLSTVDANGRTVDQANDDAPGTICKDGGGGFTYGG